MVIVNKTEFQIGVALMLTFSVVLVALMSPVHNGKALIDYLDDLFNQLTKGSAHYIPDVLEKADKFVGKPFELITAPSASLSDIPNLTKMLPPAGAAIVADGATIQIAGDFGLLAKAALADAELEFQNKGAEIEKKYGIEAREILHSWWNLFNKLGSQYKIANKAPEFGLANDVARKALEPAYNFEGIRAVKIGQMGSVTAFLLVFYVIYTVWYGFAILYLFEGFGIVASAHDKKVEA